MTRYAVGDLQGCLDPLRRLLDRVRFEPARDQLWSTGDLVNRGPQSLACLRFLRDLGASARVVLGNHDLHLLAVAHGIKKLKKGDTLREILDAPDCAELLDWLTRQPLFYRDPTGDYALVHAGLAPTWSIAQAQALSDELVSVMRSPRLRDYLEGMYGDQPDCWDDALTDITRWRVATNYLTRMRICDANGRLDLRFKEAPEAAPAGFMPWYDAPQRRSAGQRIIFGHWAALMGRAARDDVIALDTGCIWGGAMTLYDLERARRYQCDCESASA
jgi:bis(5'-nucleosyl)-tetraphosphatase (symmetrical)